MAIFKGSGFITLSNINDGKDGDSAYIHIKYSNDGGMTFTANNGNDPGEYLGTFSSHNPAAPTTPSSYTWKKITGENGLQGTDGTGGGDAYNVSLSNSCSVVLCDYEGAPVNCDASGFFNTPFLNEINVYMGGEKLQYWAGSGTSLINTFNISDSLFLQPEFDGGLAGYNAPEIIGTESGALLKLKKITSSPLIDSVNIPITITITDANLNKIFFNLTWNVIKTISGDADTLKRLLTENDTYSGTFTLIDENNIERLVINADAIKAGYLSAERIDFNGASMTSADGKKILSINNEGLFMNGKFHIMKVFDETSEQSIETTQPFLIQRKIKKYGSDGTTIIETDPESLVYFSANNNDDNFFINNATMPSITVTQRIKLGSLFEVIINEDSVNETSHVVLL